MTPATNKPAESRRFSIWRQAALALSLLWVSCLSTSSVWGQAAEMATGSRGMVSSAHPLATEAGLAILKREGNAFDAAVAVATTLNVVEPMNSGLGGYGTILVHVAKDNETRFLNCSGRIPMTLDSDAFRAPTPDYMENRRGAKAVSTPGYTNALQSMSDQYGSLAWPELFTSAIEAAEKGFVVDRRTASTIANAFSSFPKHAQAIYGRRGQPLASGNRLIQSDLAKSLRAVAEQGARAVHGGSLGEAIARAMREADGFLTLNDLGGDKPEWWTPIEIDYRGHRVVTASPPSTAFPSLIRLGMMSQFGGPALEHNSVDYLHRFAEVSKHAFWCRLAYAGDPDLNPPPLDKLLSNDYWAKQVADIDPQRSRPFEPPAISESIGKNTTHFVVADRWGNIVSATVTLGNSFGSRIMPQGTGIWLNNSLAYCTFEPKGNPMDAHAGHHKLSGDCPTIIFKDSHPWAALGTPGGHTIGQTVPQIVMNLIDHDMNIQQAIAAERISFAEPNLLLVESGLGAGAVDGLTRRGHSTRLVGGIGNAHGLTIDRDSTGNPVGFSGAADPRGNGLARGF